MARKITLSAVNSELRLKNSGITIRVHDPDDQQRSGRLRIGRAKIVWTPRYKHAGGKKEVVKKWEDLIDFLLRR